MDNNKVGLTLNVYRVRVCKSRELNSALHLNILFLWSLVRQNEMDVLFSYLTREKEKPHTTTSCAIDKKSCVISLFIVSIV